MTVELETKRYIRTINDSPSGYLSVGIPHNISKEMQLKPHEYLQVYQSDNKIVMERVEL